MTLTKYIFILGFIGYVYGGVANAADIKTQIKSMAPNAYWSLENSFSSQIPHTQTINFVAQENGGASAIFDNTLEYYSPDYFPITPQHLSVTPDSNALWFGETKGDLAGVTRYLKLTANEIGGNTQPLTAFNMDEKKEWTLHLLVSPDPDPTNIRQPEVVFFSGNNASDVQDPKNVSNIQVLVDAKANGTKIQVIRSGQQYLNGPEILITDNPQERHWYQIVIRFGLRPNDSVTDLKLDVADNNSLIRPPVAYQSNQWLITPNNSSMYVGKGYTNQYFNGAIAHLALWKRALTNGEVTNLKSSLKASTATTPLMVDIAQSPTFFMWTVPIVTTPLISNTRNALNWNDSIWKLEGVYPMVRHKIDTPSAPNQNPPDYVAPLGANAKDTAMQTFGWIQYIDSMLWQYAGRKSLKDGVGYSIFWNDWGHATYKDSTATGYYSDRGAARGLMYNWRDAPRIWRKNIVHASVPDPHELIEISTPFYREGMSQNAFRSAAIFNELNRLLNTNTSLGKPSRLHFDVEGNKNFSKIGNGSSCADGNTNKQVGWFCGAILDDRATNFDGWGAKAIWGLNDSSFGGNCSGVIGTDTTVDSSGVTLPNSRGLNERTLNALLQKYKLQYGVWQSPNACFREAFNHFADANYQYALNESLKKPAMQQLNSNIRVSEYGQTATGTSLGSAAFSIGRDNALMGVGKPNYLDFSAPVLYPPGRDAIDIDLNITFNNSYDLSNWQRRLGLSYPFFSGGQTSLSYKDSSANQVREAIDNLYVETQKHNLNIAIKAGQTCAPIVQSPWFPYPTEKTEGLPYTNLPVYTVRWQEVARLAAFAYRKGVREFLMWGYYENMNAMDKTSSVVGLEEIFKVVNRVRNNPLDLTTTGALSRDNDNFGIPDGIVNQADLDYFTARYNEGDPEADLVTQNGQCALPDGKITIEDSVAFTTQYGNS